jgi:hypothetical protein
MAPLVISSVRCLLRGSLPSISVDCVRISTQGTESSVDVGFNGTVS